VSVNSSDGRAFFDLFERVYVINLREREDRRREVEAQLRRFGLGLGRGKVELFEAVKPADPGGFPSIGARGCFESHLGVLRRARESGRGPVLILEDDVDATDALSRSTSELVGGLRTQGWSLFYGGYGRMDPCPPPPSEASLLPVPASTGIVLAHSLGVSAAAAADLVPYLERISARAPGDARGGPMHVDGAYSWFRREHPDHRTLISREQLFVQRSSRSDITAEAWKERIPGMPALRRLRNGVRRLTSR
jgi:hypothetical protein